VIRRLGVRTQQQVLKLEFEICFPYPQLLFFLFFSDQTVRCRTRLNNLMYMTQMRTPRLEHQRMLFTRLGLYDSMWNNRKRFVFRSYICNLKSSEQFSKQMLSIFLGHTELTQIGQTHETSMMQRYMI
jgi:hypothetical protein